MTQHGTPIIRLFRVRAKPGSEAALAAKLASVSLKVVEGHKGYLGHLLAGPANDGERDFLFASVWTDNAAIVTRFGEAWRSSHLPEGYAELIEDCSVAHLELRSCDLLHH